MGTSGGTLLADTDTGDHYKLGWLTICRPCLTQTRNFIKELRSVAHLRTFLFFCWFCSRYSPPGLAQ
eukprot:scaffold19281_cov21-Prasinocladus_malaysianus.AAC.1